MRRRFLYVNRLIVPAVPPVTPEGWQSSAPDASSMFSTAFSTVGGDYFRTLQIALHTGRVFGPQDGEGAPRVAVIGAQFARHAWPQQDAVGKRIRTGSRSRASLRPAAPPPSNRSSR
jgi:hypothetical protein